MNKFRLQEPVPLFRNPVYGSAQNAPLVSVEVFQNHHRIPDRYLATKGLLIWHAIRRAGPRNKITNVWLAGELGLSESQIKRTLQALDKYGVFAKTYIHYDGVFMRRGKTVPRITYRTIRCIWDQPRRILRSPTKREWIDKIMRPIAAKFPIYWKWQRCVRERTPDGREILLDAHTNEYIVDSTNVSVFDGTLKLPDGSIFRWDPSSV